MSLETPNDVLTSVRNRYAEGAATQVPELCCPVDYDASLLKVLPQEIIDRDYGCGDPSRFVKRGDVVLDLGSGAGKICYMASQLAGPEGRVIGVDTTDEMLKLARDHAPGVGDAIGWRNVEFRRGLIQDLGLDLDQVDAWIQKNPIQDLAGRERLQAEETRLRAESPMIADESVDLVLSNCVLNLVDPADKPRMFREIHRVLRRGGRAAISDIVCDEDVPEELQRDPELWSGCISGALREDRFLQAFADAGLYGVEIAAYQSEPWAVVRGIEFRSMTVVAYKGKEGPCWDHGEAVIYKGPFAAVTDDDGHVMVRGERTAVCRKTLGILTSGPYADSFQAVKPLVEIAPEDAAPFDCRPSAVQLGASPLPSGSSNPAVRTPAETKRGIVREDVAPGVSCCEPGDDGEACC